MKKNTMNVEYSAPEMEVVLAVVENGFLGSGFGEKGYPGQNGDVNDYEGEL